MTNDIILQAKGLKKYYGKGETMVRARSPPCRNIFSGPWPAG